MKRKFLLPITVSVAALSGAFETDAKLTNDLKQNNTQTLHEVVLKNLSNGITDGLILEPSKELAPEMAYHRSHQSHRSHYSHQSHRSHYSSYR